MALIKYVEFGGTDPNTGEKRVQLIDNDLIKTASNEIQDYWRELVRKPECFYLHVIAMSAGEYWGPNKRSDWYGEDNLKKYHHQFVTQAKVYKHHINKPDSPSYGRVLYSFYNDNMHRVELILEVDKENAQEYVDKINNGEDIFVSMGMRVPKDECSVCGNIATKLDEYCIHGKMMKNQILEGNELVYRINHAPYNLFDISLVTRPADPVAWALEKAASANTNMDFSTTTRVLDEDVYNTEILIKEAVDKVADMIKKVDTPILNAATGLDNNIKKLKTLSTPIKFPQRDYYELKQLNIDPAIALSAAFMGVTHLSLNELAYYIGKLVLRKLFNRQIHKLMCRHFPLGVSLAKADPIMGVKFIPHISKQIRIIASNDIDVDDMLDKLNIHIEDSRDRLNIIKEGGLNETANFYKHPEDYVTSVTYKDLHMMPNTGVVEFVNKHNPSDKYLVSVRDINNLITLDRPLQDRFGVQPAAKLAGLLAMLGGAASLLGKGSEASVLGIPAMIIGGLLLSKAKPSDETIKPNKHFFIEKKSSDINILEKLAALPTLPLVGVGIPTLLAGDYLYNKKRAESDPSAINNMGDTHYKLFRAGEHVVNNPLLSIGASIGALGVGKGLTKSVMGKFKPKKKRRFF